MGRTFARRVILCLGCRHIRSSESPTTIPKKSDQNKSKLSVKPQVTSIGPDSHAPTRPRPEVLAENVPEMQKDGKTHEKRRRRQQTGGPNPPPDSARQDGPGEFSDAEG